MHDNKVIVLGGVMFSRNSMEIWKLGVQDSSWAPTSIAIGGNYGNMITAGKSLYLLGGWEYQDIDPYTQLKSSIWKVNKTLGVEKVGEMSHSKIDFIAFTLPHGYLTDCQGMHILIFEIAIINIQKKEPINHINSY